MKTRFILCLALLLQIVASGQVRQEEISQLSDEFGIQSRQPTMINNTLAGKTIVFLLDSYGTAVGYGVGGNNARWTTIACSWLGATESNVSVAGMTLSGAGKNISGCGRASAGAYMLPTKTSSIARLVIGLGLNDVGINDGVYSTPDSFSYYYRRLLDSTFNYYSYSPDSTTLIGIPYIRNYLGYVGGCTVTTSADETRALRYNDTVRLIAAQYGCTFMDIREFQRQTGNPDSLIHTDGLHPDSAGHRIYARRFVNLIRTVPEPDSVIRVYAPKITVMTTAVSKAMTKYITSHRKNFWYSSAVGLWPLYGNWGRNALTPIIGNKLTCTGSCNFNTGSYVNTPVTRGGINTGVSPSQMNSAGWTLVISIGNDVSETKIDWGVLQATTNTATLVSFQSTSTSSQGQVRAGGTITNFTNATSSGVYVVVFTASSVTVYKNGTQLVNSTGLTNNFTSTESFYIGNANDGTNPSSKKIRLVELINKALNSSEAATISSDEATLETSLSR